MRERLEELASALSWYADARVRHPAFEYELRVRILADGNVQSDFTFLGKFDRIREQVQQDLSEARGVTKNIERDILVNVEEQREAFFTRLLGDQFKRFFDQRNDFKRYRFERHVARFNFRKIQYIVDESQQRIAGRTNQADVVALLVVQAGFIQQARHAKHTVQRGTDFVAHGGKECLLRTSRLGNAHVGFHQFNFRYLPIRHIRDGTDKPHRTPVGIARRDRTDAHPPVARVLAFDPRLNVKQCRQPL